MRARLLATRRLCLTIGEELQRERYLKRRRSFFVQLGELLAALIILEIIWFK